MGITIIMMWIVIIIIVRIYMEWVGSIVDTICIMRL